MFLRVVVSVFSPLARVRVRAVQIEPLAAFKPLLSCPGNHELEWSNANTQLFLGYESRYHMPQVRTPPTAEHP